MTNENANTSSPLHGCSQDELYVKVLQWVDVLLIMALGALLLVSGFTMVVQASSSPWYASGAKITGTTAALMTLIAQVFRQAHPTNTAAAAPR